MRKVAGRLAAVGIIFGFVHPRSAAAQDTPTASATAVKAAYLLNFTRYVEWPAAAFRNNRSPIVICVVGADPFGSVLDDIVRDRRVQGRAVQVRRLKAPQASADCHVAFIGSGDAALERAEATWRGRPVLLVGDGTAFAAGGGAIAFVAANETIRFEVNAGAAREHGLQISSRVLALATQVYGVKEGP